MSNSLGVMVGALCAASVRAELPVYAIEPIGLTDAEHTRPVNGRRISAVYQVLPDGTVFGRSNRYREDSSLIGNTDWVFDGSVYTTMGLTDSEHTAPSGYRISDGLFVTSAGVAGGEARRYVTVLPGNTVPNDQSAWVFDGTTTHRVGFYGPDYTSAQLRNRTELLFMNAAGLAAGNSSQYFSASEFGSGYSAWQSTGPTTELIGLTGPDYTDPDGGHYNVVVGLAENGVVAGWARRSVTAGSMAWAHAGGGDDGSGPVRCGAHVAVGLPGVTVRRHQQQRANDRPLLSLRRHLQTRRIGLVI